MSEVTWMERDVNPITKLDYPDVDVIRVENTYYMVSTTMHFMPAVKYYVHMTLFIGSMLHMCMIDWTVHQGRGLRRMRTFTEKECGQQAFVAIRVYSMCALLQMIQARLICFSRRISMDHGRNRQLKGFIMIVHCYLMTMTECILHPGIRIFV